MSGDLISTATAARRLQVTPARVRAMIASGRLPAVKVGRDWLIRTADLELVPDKADRRPGRPKAEHLTAAEYQALGVLVVNDKLRIPILQCAACGHKWAGRDWRCPNGCNAAGELIDGGEVTE